LGHYSKEKCGLQSMVPTAGPMPYSGEESYANYLSNLNTATGLYNQCLKQNNYEDNDEDEDLPACDKLEATMNSFYKSCNGFVQDFYKYFDLLIDPKLALRRNSIAGVYTMVQYHTLIFHRLLEID
jgi:hypothetical protein